MTAKAVTDELLGRYARKTRELQERFEKGVVDPAVTLQGLQQLIEGSRVTVPAIHLQADPYTEYRQVKGLVFIGPSEWEKAMTSRDRRNRNPLGLKAGWCPKPDLQYPVDQLQKLVVLCRTPEWNTISVVWLALPEVASTSTSLVGQYSWWGIRHDNMGPGNVRKDVFWSNWFHSQDETWKDEPAVIEPTWMLGFEHPRWTTGKNWIRQQEVATDHGMTISTVAQDTLMLNLMASAGKRPRLSTWSRTSTVYGGDPLLVRSNAYGVYVYSYWSPQNALDNLAASVQGMPSGLVP